MCKNLFVVGIKPENTKNLWKFLIEATPFMTARDNDGLGYAAFGKHGLWGERWLNPGAAWKERPTFDVKDGQIEKDFTGALVSDLSYNSFGAIDSDNTTAVLLHARMATCGKGLDNVHPFVRDNTALVHNGVISNANAKHLYVLNSTCDSETILNEYVDSDVSNKPESIATVAEALEGYYACGVLTQDDKGNRYVDIFKNPTASLVAAYIKELDAVAWCTNSEILSKTVEKLGWTMGYVFKVEQETLIRLDAVTGKLLSTHKFKSTAFGGSSGQGLWNGGGTRGKHGTDNLSAWQHEGYDDKDGFDYVGEGYRSTRQCG